jgi:outer membrane protein assembly factor BamD
LLKLTNFSVIKNMKFIILLSMFLSLVSCDLFQEKEVDEYQGFSPKDLFLEAKKATDNLETDNAIEIYEQILARYPTSKYAVQAKLEIPYTLYKADRHNQAIVAINDFIKLYPNHDSTAYAYYLRGVVSAAKSQSVLDELNITDRANRDVGSVKDALNYYIELIKTFPKSKYADEAKSQMITLKNILARHELSVAIFYTKQEAYIAAVNRCKYIIEKYQNTPSVPAALHLMAHNYELLGQQDLATDVKRVLTSNYPKYTPHYSLGE